MDLWTKERGRAAIGGQRFAGKRLHVQSGLHAIIRVSDVGRCKNGDKKDADRHSP